jgi:hypothetical protein
MNMQTIINRLSILPALLLAINVHAQVVNTGVMDTTDFRYQGKVTVEGYIDGYYSYDFNKPPSGNKPYAVSMARHNEMTINLAFVDLKYSSSRLRARVVPGFGTYINANYSAEPGALKYLVEASAGIKVLKSRSVWLDFGVFGSPYTNESAISKDHLAYTRSFAPEFVPYYLSGLKLSTTLGDKVNGYLYVVNGWQQIQDSNPGKSLGTQLEYRPNGNWLINWNTYTGSERSDVNPAYGTRYFTDLFFIYAKGKWTSTGCVYIGMQQRDGAAGAYWWQANIIGRYDLTSQLSVTGRIEYFEDPEGVVAKPLAGAPFFSSFSSSLGVNQKPAENVLLRLEYRTYVSANQVFETDEEPSNRAGVITANITVWF